MDGNGKKKEEEPVYINMIAGGISGAASKTATAPLARLTILYQVQSFNKGTHPHPPDLSTQALPIRTPPPSPPNPFSPLPSGSTSGSSSKGQQACTARPHAAPHPYLCRPPPPPHPPSLTQAMRNLVATEGVAALWRGNLATIIHRLPYSATNFAVFEAANKGLAPHMQSDIGRRLTAGATSGLVACIVAYPLDLVRTRLSAQRGGASNNPHQTRPLPPLAYNLPVRQGGGSGSSSNSSDTGKVLRESSATGSTHAGGGGSSSNSGGGSVKNLRMSSTTGSTNVSSSSSNNRLGMAGRPFLGPSPSSHINLCLNQQQRQQPPVSPHITLYPPNTQSPCVAQPCHASSAHPSASQLPLQQAQVLHQNAHPQPPLPSGHCLPRSNQPPLQLASSQFPCFHTPHYPWQQQQQQQPQQHLQQVLQQQQQHQLRLHHQQVQMQAQQSCLQHQQWQQPHTSSHHCPHTSSLCRSTPTMPRGSAAASLAALHRHGSTAFLITSLKSPSAEPSFQAKLRATARSAHLSTTTHTSSGGAAAAAASKKNVAATSKAAMSTASATPVPHVTPATSAPHYRGIVHALTHIVQQEGVLGLYRGLGATLLQVTPSLALNFALYDSFKDAWLKHAVTQSFEEGAWIGHIIPWSLKASSGSSSSVSVSAGNSRSSSRIPGDIVPQSLRSTNDDTDSKISNSGSGGSAAHPPHMTTSSSLVCGAAAGFCSSTLTFPLDLIRRRVQVSHRHSAGPHPSATSEYLAVWRQVYMANGLRGFYAGIMTEYAKVLPGMAIAFTVYEGTKELLKNVAFE